MEPLLYLVHRIPYPPNKGDKIRSYHLLRHLAGRFRVHLACFIDQPEDAQHLPQLEALCASQFCAPLKPSIARVRSFSGLLNGEPLTLPYYRDARLQRWVGEAVASHGIRKAVVFSSAMTQYVPPGTPYVLDMVDVDSAKWTQYATEHAWPASLIYRREGQRLLAHERAAASEALGSVFVTAAEAALFVGYAPEAAGRVHAIENGVDGDYFSPSPDRPSPYAAGERPIVFTGVMDYWPNVDAVSWFARDVLPRISAQAGDVRFYVVGMNPSPVVEALRADARVVVTGKVPDVRPYLQHAACVVAPLRVARGVQNKVLEAMAMACPVVCSRAAAAGVAATPGHEFETAESATEFADRVLAMLAAPDASSMGERARRRIREHYDWDRSLSRFDGLLDAVGPPPSTAVTPAIMPLMAEAEDA